MPFGSVEKMWKENLKMHHMAAILVPKSAGWLSLSVNFWLKNKITIVSHPLYSRLTAMWLIYFPKIQDTITVRWFNDITMTEAEWHGVPAKLPTIHFRKCLKSWHDCRAHFIPFQGDYMEEDNVD